MDAGEQFSLQSWHQRSSGRDLKLITGMPLEIIKGFQKRWKSMIATTDAYLKLITGINAIGKNKRISKEKRHHGNREMEILRYHVQDG